MTHSRGGNEKLIATLNRYRSACRKKKFAAEHAAVATGRAPQLRS